MTLGLNTLHADFKDDIDFTKLHNEYGNTLPDGSTVKLAQIEYIRSSAWAPRATGEIASKSFVYMSNLMGAYSSHAITVAGYLGGSSTSITPKTAGWACYEATSYVGRGFLNGGRAAAPGVCTWDVENHSWGGNDSIFAINKLQKLDGHIDRDNVVAVVGVDNGPTLSQMLANCYNAIAVGSSTGNHPQTGTTLEVAARMKPDIVGTYTYTSYATPIVGSCATLLIGEIKRSPGLLAARSSLVIKSLLLAGATKSQFPGWTRTPQHPLDRIYGAGQVNIYNSYKALIAGRQLPGAIGSPKVDGWDANTTSTSTRSLYYVTVPAGKTLSLSAVLSWNRHIDTNIYWQVLSPRLSNLDLVLWKLDAGYNPVTRVDQSISTIDNVEHVYQTALPAGTYALEVVSPVAGEKFGIAWKGTLR